MADKTSNVWGGTRKDQWDGWLHCGKGNLGDGNLHLAGLGMGWAGYTIWVEGIIICRIWEIEMHGMARERHMDIFERVRA